MKSAGKMYLVVAFDIHQGKQSYPLVTPDNAVAHEYIGIYSRADFPHGIISVDVQVSDDESKSKECKRCAGNLYCTCPF